MDIGNWNPVWMNIEKAVKQGRMSTVRTLKLELSHMLLSETGKYDDPHQQVKFANKAWEWFRPAGEKYRS